MKILQVNAVYKTKSTGRMVYEMHNYFMSKGHESYVAYGTENVDNGNDPNVFRIGNTLDHKIHALAYRIDRLQGAHSKVATKIFLKKVKKIRPDVILIHNIHSNFFHFEEFAKGIKILDIPVVMVMHDCWYMTGGCYYYTEYNCKKWKNQCFGCPVFGNVAIKKYETNCRIMDELHPTIIAISKWVESELKYSLLKNKTEIRMIYNWIDGKTFYPRINTNIRKKYGIKEGMMVLGVATEWSKKKGLDEMINIAEAHPNWNVVLVGKQISKSEFPNNLVTVPFTDSKEELAEIYSGADIFLNPSRQETFGLVTAEALACGTPVIVYDNTACPEFVTDTTGIVVRNGQQFNNAILMMIQKIEQLGVDAIRKNCVEFVKDNFSMETNVRKYLDVFTEIMAKKHEYGRDYE